jgi:hypothetical protein
MDPRFTYSIIRRSFVNGVQNKKLKRTKVSYNVAGGKFYTNYEVK